MLMKKLEPKNDLQKDSSEFDNGIDVVDWT